jgi:hypothetical protein
LSAASPIPGEGVSLEGTEQPAQAEALEPPKALVEEDSNSTQTELPKAVYGIVAVLVGFVALLAFVKLRPVRVDLPSPNSNPSTPEMRRAALEALLSKQEKKG